MEVCLRHLCELAVDNFRSQEDACEPEVRRVRWSRVIIFVVNQSTVYGRRASIGWGARDGVTSVGSSTDPHNWGTVLISSVGWVTVPYQHCPPAVSLPFSWALRCAAEDPAREIFSTSRSSVSIVQSRRCKLHLPYSTSAEFSATPATYSREKLSFEEATSGWSAVGHPRPAP